MRKNSKQSTFFCSLVLLTLFPFGGLWGQTVEDRIAEFLGKMTLQEKILRLHQEGSFNTQDNTRLGIPGFFMTDSPHAVREGLATCFPVGIAMAATWDPDLIRNIGEAMGKEFRGKGKNQALGPCIATIKHYNCGHRQVNRHTANILASQRLLQEHYGLNSYNLINGAKCAENVNIQWASLRGGWGFPYYIFSDWGAIWNSASAIMVGTSLLANLAGPARSSRLLL